MSSLTKSNVFVKLICIKPTTPPSLRNSSIFRRKTAKQNKSQQSVVIYLWENTQGFFSCLQAACMSVIIPLWPGDRLFALPSIQHYLTHCSYQKVFPGLGSSWFLSVEGLHFSALPPLKWFSLAVSWFPLLLMMSFIPTLCTDLVWSPRHIIQQFAGCLLTFLNLPPIIPAQQPPVSLNSWRTPCNQRDEPLVPQPGRRKLSFLHPCLETSSASQKEEGIDRISPSTCGIKNKRVPFVPSPP